MSRSRRLPRTNKRASRQRRRQLVPAAPGEQHAVLCRSPEAPHAFRSGRRAASAMRSFFGFRRRLCPCANYDASPSLRRVPLSPIIASLRPSALANGSVRRVVGRQTEKVGANFAVSRDPEAASGADIRRIPRRNRYYFAETLLERKSLMSFLGEG